MNLSCFRLEAAITDPPLVILVEDDAGVRDALEFLLQVDGYRTRSYRLGTDFLAQADLSEAVCLVLDYHLPGLSGIEVLSILRERGIAIPTVFVTGAPTPLLQRKASELGAVAVLEKPLSNDELSQAIRHIVTAVSSPRE